MNTSGAPMITDVTVRISDAGDMFALEFEASDGKARSVALPVASLPKLISSLMWAGAESGERRVNAPLSLAERETLQHGARAISDWRVTRVPDGREVALELESGAGLLSVRVPPLAARLLGLALQTAAGDVN